MEWLTGHHNRLWIRSPDLGLGDISVIADKLVFYNQYFFVMVMIPDPFTGHLILLGLLWLHSLFFSFFDAKDERYNPEMYPIISKEKWRKGSQVLYCFSIYFYFLLKIWNIFVKCSLAVIFTSFLFSINFAI